MKTRILMETHSFYKLVIDIPGIENDELPVLMRAVLYEGTSCWAIEDVRLTNHGKPDPYFCIGAEDFHAHTDFVSKNKAKLLRSTLSNYVEKPNENGMSKFAWCTFNGLVKGQSMRQLIGHSHRKLDAEIYFKHKDVRVYFKAAQEFWADMPFKETDADVVNLAGVRKIRNPNRQLRIDDVNDLLRKVKDVEDVIDLVKPDAAQEGKSAELKAALDLQSQLCSAVFDLEGGLKLPEALMAGADINGVHGDGIPLRCVALSDQVSDIEKVLVLGANPNAIFTDNGKQPDCLWPTALHLAVAHEKMIFVIALLAKGADMNLALPGGLSALQLAQKTGTQEILEAFTHPLHAAASLGMVNQCLGLIRMGWDPMVKPQSVPGSTAKPELFHFKRNALQSAEKMGYPDCANAMRSMLAILETNKAMKEIKGAGSKFHSEQPC